MPIKTFNQKFKKLLLAILILILLISPLFYYPTNTQAADNGNSEADRFYKEVTGWYETQIMLRLDQHGVTATRIFNLLLFLEQSNYFMLPYDKKIIFIHTYSGVNEWPELDWIADIDQINTQPLLGTVIKADDRSWFDRFMQDFSGPTHLLDFENRALSNFTWQFLIFIKPTSKSTIAQTNLDYLYMEGPLKKYFYKKDTRRYPTFSDIEVQLLKGWAIDITATASFNIAAGISGAGIQTRGGAILKKVSARVSRNWKEMVGRIWKTSSRATATSSIFEYKPMYYIHDIQWIHGQGPRSGNLEIWQAKTVYLARIKDPSLAANREANKIFDSFNLAVTKFNSYANRYNMSVNMNDLMEMSYFSDSLPSECSARIPACYLRARSRAESPDFPVGRILFKNEFFFTDTTLQNAEIIIHEKLHDFYNAPNVYELYRGSHVIPNIDRAQEGINDFLALQMFEGGYRLYENEAQAAYKLMRKIRDRYYPNMRSPHLALWLAYSKHNSLNAAQRIDAYFSTPNTYRKLNDLLIELSERYYHPVIVEQKIDMLINSLQFAR